MEKNEVVAYLIMEAATDPVKPQNIQVFDKNNLFYLKFETCLQEFNVKNRNRRIYLKEAMIESLNSPHIQELIKKKSWKGEAGHPLDSDIKRILTIDPKLTSHKINSFYCEGNFLKGEVETLDDDGYVRRMTKNILQGMEPAFSLRALAPLMKKPDGTELVRAKAHIVTYDWVILPSHDKAYRDESKPIQKIIKNIQDSGNSVTESVSIPVFESQVLDYIKEESKNIKLISNVCEVSLGTLVLSKDGKYAILKEDGSTYYVKIEDKIKADIRDFMSKF